MTPLPPFDRMDDNVKRSLTHILDKAPVLNLTHLEVLSTLRLLRLQLYLADRQYGDIYVHNNDQRLQDCDDTDRFLALLLECEQRDLLLGTKRCRLRFGGTTYHWCRIARDTGIVTASSTPVPGTSPSGKYSYRGRGWRIAPNIITLRRWIVQTSTNPEYKRLKV